MAGLEPVQIIRQPEQDGWASRGRERPSGRSRRELVLDHEMMFSTGDRWRHRTASHAVRI